LLTTRGDQTRAWTRARLALARRCDM
jgi:hypothetical protein